MLSPLIAEESAELGNVLKAECLQTKKGAPAPRPKLPRVRRPNIPLMQGVR